MYPSPQPSQLEDGITLFDTHCHLDLEPLYQRLPEVLEAARQARVTGFVVPGVHPEGWERIAGIARSHDTVYPAYGVHPEYANLLDVTLVGRLAEMAATGVAIGEIGLDKSLPMPMDVQERAFRNQIRLAMDLGLPVIIHSRRACQLTFKILKEEHVERVGGVMHSFSGSLEMAREFIRFGLAISISGTVTWENAVSPARLSRELPLESLVLESDAPSRAPQPFKGEPNQPAWMVETLIAVAKFRDMLVGDVAKAVLANSKRVFKKI